MSKLTKGMATFNKTTGEFDVSDVDYDKFRAIAESTGIQVNDLIQSSKRLNQINFAKKQIFVGSDEDREMLATLATFKPGSTIGTIKINGNEVKLTELTQEQLNLYKQQEKTLKQRAEDSQNFNESWSNTIMQLKSTLVPLLDLINKGLVYFNKTIDGFRDSTGALSSWAAIVPIGGLLLGAGGGAIIMGLSKALFSLVGGGVGKFFDKIGGGLSTNMSGSVTSLSLGLKNLTGIGIAAIGAGAGLYFASKGASSLLVVDCVY